MKLTQAGSSVKYVTGHVALFNFLSITKYFALQCRKGEIDPTITMWLVNAAFLLLALILNIWDTVWMRRLRAKFYQGAA